MAPPRRTLLFAYLFVAAVALVLPIAQTTILPRQTITIKGTLYCTATGNPNTGFGGAIISPRFRNAKIDLLCGYKNTFVSSMTTNLLGDFTSPVNNSLLNFNQTLYCCKLVVKTPLSTCNRALSTKPDNLQSKLKLQQFVVGLLSYTLAPAEFKPTM